MIHRDLKPHNILLDAAGQPHVADFGLAKVLEESAAGLPAQLAVPPRARRLPPADGGGWEYACRAGTATRYGFGGDAAQLVHYGWTVATAGKATRVGGLLRPNLAGLFDLHGDAFEWCHDWHGDYPDAPVSDPIGHPLGGPGRILRGGSWMNDAAAARSALRHFAPPATRDKSYGFRLACTLATSGRDGAGRAAPDR